MQSRKDQAAVKESFEALATPVVEVTHTALFKLTTEWLNHVNVVLNHLTLFKK
jgi:hypothetical protein